MDLRTTTPDELQQIIERHAKWLNDEEGGARANLRAADLSYADLRAANLSYADLSAADLSYANLRAADLSYANLSYADLRYANLRYANLSDASGLFVAIRGLRWGVEIIRHSDDALVWMRIGCQYHSSERWANFSDRCIAKMDSQALPFWQIHRTMLLAACDSLQARYDAGVR